MASYKGRDGLIKIGTVTIAELKSWSLDTTQETIDDTVMGDAWRTHLLGMKAYSGSFTCNWDKSDTNGQMALDITGTKLGTATGTFYPNGTGTDGATYSGVFTITSVSRSAALDGAVEATYQFTGNGSLAQA